MDKNKVIIGILIVAAIAFLVGIMASMPDFSKEDSKLEIVSNSTLNEDSHIEVKLTDVNNTPIANETVNVTLTDENSSRYYYSAITCDDGVAKLKLDKIAGNYTLNCSYAGNDKYSGNETSQNLTIKEKVVEAESNSSSDSSDDYVYSAQGDKYIKKSGQYDSDGRGNTVYSYQGGDGVIYERYYDSNGKEISANDYYK